MGSYHHNMIASDRAVKRLRDELIKKFLNVGLGYRIVGNTRETGCTAFTIELDKERPSDEMLKLQDIRIFLDQVSADLLRGFELDYQDGPTCGFYLRSSEVATGRSQVSEKTLSEKVSVPFDQNP